MLVGLRVRRLDSQVIGDRKQIEDARDGLHERQRNDVLIVRRKGRGEANIHRDTPLAARWGQKQRPYPAIATVSALLSLSAGIFVAFRQTFHHRPELSRQTIARSCAGEERRAAVISREW